MAIWGEASYKVKRAITFHERFTVAELVDATNLAYAQVEQVVQRLIKQGYVRKLKPNELNEAERAVTGKVGRPRQRHTLIEDKAKREEFYASVEAIASAERLSHAKERKPSTPYFNRAMQVIEAMERGAEPPSTARLDEAAALLAYGRDFEGLIPEGAEIVQAYYDYAQARLEAQRGNYPKAEELLAQAKEAFLAAELDERVQRTIDLELAFQASQGFAEIKEMIERQANPMPALEALRRLVYDFPSPSHLRLPLQQAIEAISAAFEAGVRVAARGMQIVSIGRETMGREPVGVRAYIPTERKSSPEYIYIGRRRVIEEEELICIPASRRDEEVIIIRKE